MQKSEVKDLTVGSPMKLILSFAVPMLLGFLFQQFYNMVDTIIVGKCLGVSSLAAVGSTGSINFMIIGFCTGACSGFAIPVAQKFGAGDYTGMRKFVANAGWLSAVFAVVMTTIVGLLCMNILQWMNTPEDIIQGAYDYIFVIFLGIPVTYLYNMLAGIIRSLGDSKTPVYFLLLSSLMNIGLDFFTILVLGMGVGGPALATVISQGISAVLCLIYMIRHYPILHMKNDECKPDGRMLGTLCSMGIPMGLQYSITAIGSVIMQWAVNVLGSTAVAAVTAASKTMNLLTVPLESVGTAMATYSGQNLGAARMDRVRKGVTSALLIATVYSIASALILHFADVAVMSLFLDTTTEVEIVAMGREYLFWNSVFFVPLGALIVWRYSIQGLGFSTLAMMAGVAEMIARTAVAIVLVPMLGYFGAELANPAAWIAACVFLYPAYRWTCRQLDNRLLAARLHIQSESPEHEAAL